MHNTSKVAPPPYVHTVERDGLRAMRLTWWRIRGYKNDINPGVDARYERRGWLGLTATNMSDHEFREIRKWFREREGAWVSKRIGDCDEPHIREMIGEYEDHCVTMWFATEALLDAFVEFLKAFPVRDTALLISRSADVRHLITGTNFRIIRGRDHALLAITDEVDDTSRMLLRLI
jgi:hypothetical protein